MRIRLIILAVFILLTFVMCHIRDNYTDAPYYDCIEDSGD